MHCIFIHGPVASGKLTVAGAVQAGTGLRLFHNHYAVDAALSLFEFGSPAFVRLRELIWLSAFKEAAQAGVSFIFTFHPEASVTRSFIETAVNSVEGEGGRVIFVALTCADDVVESRVDNASRSAFRKLTSPTQYRQLRDQGAFSFASLPEPDLTIATDRLSPSEAADQIAALLARLAVA